MGKTVYSLVLSDEIVAAVDALASKQGLSRSALVEQILARHASLQTPADRAQLVLDTLMQEAQHTRMRTAAATASALTMKTALLCKYNPALTYTVEVRAHRDGLGQLKVALRSQNAQVLDYFSHFFDLGQRLEGKYLKNPPPPHAHYKEPKRYTRQLRMPPSYDEARTGHTLAGYVRLMDDCMRAFFQNLSSAATAVGETEAEYLLGLKKQPDLEVL